VDANADPIETWGRLISSGKRAKRAPREFAGVRVTACRQRSSVITRETHHSRSGGLQPEAREGQAGLWRVAERLVGARKPGNAGGAKEPQYKEMTEEGKTRRLA